MSVFAAQRDRGHINATVVDIVCVRLCVCVCVCVCVWVCVLGSGCVRPTTLWYTVIEWQCCLYVIAKDRLQNIYHALTAPLVGGHYKPIISCCCGCVLLLSCGVVLC